MVTGHLATAYLVRARWPRANALALLVASIIPDLADFALPQGDRCRTNCGLLTHALPAVFLLAVAAAFLAWEIFHRRATSYLVAGLVLLHVAMDLVTGNKPYWPGGPRLGLSLYARPVADFALEITLVVVGWLVLRRTRHAPPMSVHPLALGALVAIQGGMDYMWYHHMLG